jgi:hypothetical protein
MAGRRLHPQPQFFVSFIPGFPFILINPANWMRIVVTGPGARLGKGHKVLARIRPTAFTAHGR